jgi:transcriptional regulator GlxA family with amidase domain
MAIATLQEVAKTRRLAVGILIFDKVEVLDFSGPFEVLSVCRIDSTGDENVTESPFQVSLIGESKDPVTTIGGMQVLPHATIYEYSTDAANAKSLDILIIPGGYGARQVRSNPKMIQFIRDQSTNVDILASVCTGAMVLAETDVLEAGSTITTHWGMIDLLQEWYPQLQVEKDRSVIKQEPPRTPSSISDDPSKRPVIFTSAGISAGIDMCFWIINDIFGEEISRAAAKYMEYSYPEGFSRRIQC